LYKPSRRAGDWVINQGDEGNVLYVVDKGDLDCFKTFKKDEGAKYLKTYHPGESFGELALLYNVPRAASIQAKTDSTLFALDRECFNHIVKDAAAKKRAVYEEFLVKVPLLETLDPYERLTLADGLRNLKYKKGDIVINMVRFINFTDY
jgi:cAMP-dependent protein kinase regulator